MIDTNSQCKCEFEYSIEELPGAQEYILFYGRCNHRHGLNLCTISEIAYNFHILELPAKLNRELKQRKQTGIARKIVANLTWRFRSARRSFNAVSKEPNDDVGLMIKLEKAAHYHEARHAMKEAMDLLKGESKHE